MLTLPAPAKLNLMLHVTGRRPDSYHQLQTLFQLVDRGDTLKIGKVEGTTVQFSCSEPALEGSDNLVVKAVRLLQMATGCQQGARLHLHKNLPAGGGLGGGSSDCATALLGLNHLWGLKLDLNTLADLGLSLGADVPLFIRGCSAWAEGIGEELTAVNLPQHWFVVVNPGVHVNTADLFRHPELTRNTPMITIRSALAGLGHNDFEPVVRALYPEINRAFLELAELTPVDSGPVRLSGTGASLFITTRRDMAAQQILSKIHRRYPHYRAFSARGVNQSPLHRTLANLA